MKQRGAAMLYSIMMSVLAAGVVSGVVRMAAIVSSEEARAERKLRARAMADLQLANIASWAKDGSLVVGEYHGLTMANVTTGATTSALANPTGLIQVQQTVTVGNSSFLYRDYVALPSPSVSLAAPTWSGSAEPNGGGQVVGSAAIGAPDFIAATLDSVPRFSHTSSVFSQNLNMTQAGSAAIATALGVTVSQLSDYEFIAFQATRATSNNLNNVTFEFTRGNLSMFRTGGASGDVRRGTMSVSDYANAFGISASAPNAITGISVAGFDLTTMVSGTPNGPALIAASGPWNVTVTNVNVLTGNTQYAGTSSDIDTILVTGGAESATPNGLLLELSQYVTNVSGGTTATAPQPTYVRRIESVPGRAFQTSRKWAGAFPDNIKWSTYSGNLIAPATGTYTFRILQDNGARVFLNGNYICGLWNQGSGTSTSSGISLVAGQSYPLVIEYMEGGTGNENLDFQWTYPTQAWQTVPLTAVTPGLGSDIAYYNDFQTDNSSGFVFRNIRLPANGVGGIGGSGPNAFGIRTTSGGFRILGDFGGGNNNGAELTLANMTAGRYVFYFDVLFFNTWDGNNGWGPDRFRLLLNGQNHFDFSPADSPQPLILNTTTSSRFYSSNGPVFAFSMHSTGTAGGWKWSVRTEFNHPGGEMKLKFDGWSEAAQNSSGLEAINNESWALDNMALRRFRQ